MCGLSGDECRLRISYVGTNKKISKVHTVMFCYNIIKGAMCVAGRGPVVAHPLDHSSELLVGKFAFLSNYDSKPRDSVFRFVEQERQCTAVGQYVLVHFVAFVACGDFHFERIEW